MCRLVAESNVMTPWPTEHQQPQTPSHCVIHMAIEPMAIGPVDISVERRMVESSLVPMVRAGSKSNNATGGTMVDNPPQYEMIA